MGWKIEGKTFLYCNLEMGCLKILHSEQKSALSESWKIFVGGVEKTLSSEKNRINYYPFGMIQPNRSFSSPSYRYGFNGKEKDDEVSGSGNQYDYGFRIYNPRLGKFLSVDPLFKSYPWYTPYQFAGNMPIWAIDLDGLEEFIITVYRWEVSGKSLITKVRWSDLEPGDADGYGPMGTGVKWNYVTKKRDGSFESSTSYVESLGDKWDAFIAYGYSTNSSTYSSETDEKGAKDLPRNSPGLGENNEVVKSENGGLTEGDSETGGGSGKTTDYTNPADKQYSDKNQTIKSNNPSSNNAVLNIENNSSDSIVITYKAAANKGPNSPTKWLERGPVKVAPKDTVNGGGRLGDRQLTKDIKVVK